MPALTASAEITALYGDHGEWLRNWLRQRTRCSHRAADLAQDTFCRVLERKPDDAIREPRRYLATIARRILIDDVRRRDIERAYLDAYGLLGEGEHAPSPERIAEAVDLLRAVVDALGGLSDKARRSFLMIRFDGLRYAEAAAELGVSERMVKRYVAEGYARCYALAYPAE
ncbi:MAG TPA: sigma-70 family RNA polymerase sigma factor [Novosphingobium sp.]|nr:sigma-70 family RNA polymerase sigma factor [Novosphingobium sp.]